MTPKILVFGEIIWDIYPDQKLIGGAGLNFAAHGSRCGCESFMCSAVGNDSLGSDAIAAAESFGVNSEFIKKIDFPTGQCLVTINSAGIPSYNVLRGVAYDNITANDKDIEKINKIGFDALYFGSLIQRGLTSRASLRKICEEFNFGEIVCDVNLREGCYDLDSIAFCFENATVIKISDEEEPTLRHLGEYSAEDDSPESVARAISKKYTQIKYVILTLGAKGAYVYCANRSEGFFKESKKVKVASTVGAGDSFFAAWVSSYLCGESAVTATERAIALSGFVVSHTDAIPNYRFEGEIVKEI